MDFLKFEEIYKDICRDYFKNVSKVEKPKAIFLAGQPGAGKSNMAAQTKISVGKPKAVVIDPDHIRTYHPDYNKILKSGGDLYSLDSECREWKYRLIADAQKNGFNIVFDGTLGGTTEYILRDMQNCKDKGYFVQVNILATNETVSKIGITYRYELQAKKKGTGRYVDLSYHNDIYTNIPLNLQKILPTGVVSKCEVFKRDHIKKEIVKLSNHATFDTSEKGLNTFTVNSIKSLIKERSRDFTIPEVKELNTWYLNTEKLINNRGVDTSGFKDSFKLVDNTINKTLVQQISMIKGEKPIQEIKITSEIGMNY